MKPESLKKIAEALGYKAKVTPSRCSIATYPYKCCPDLVRWKLFYPQNNPAQLLEITEKFKIELKHTENEVWSKIWNRGVWMPYKTLTEAVLNEAEEFVK